MSDPITDRMIDDEIDRQIDQAIEAKHEERDFNTCLLEAFKASGKSQIEVALTLDIPPPQLNKWLKGKHLPAKPYRKMLKDLLHF